MIGTTRARFSQFQRELPFVEADLVTGTTLLQSFYISQGFPQVQIVKLATIPDNRTRSSRRDRHHQRRTTVLISDRFLSPETSESLSAEFSAKIKSLTKPPKPYSDAELQNLQRDLTFIFKTKGYLLGSVSVTPNFRGAARRPVPITGRFRPRSDLPIRRSDRESGTRMHGCDPSFYRGVSSASRRNLRSGKAKRFIQQTLPDRLVRYD